MAIKPAGTPLSMSEIAAEFGGTTPHSLSEYYRGGGLVPNGPAANNGIATSGAINMGGFYGATNRIQQTITLASNQTNYVLNTAKVTGYTAGVMDITLVINSGVYVSANSTGAYALNVDTSWNAGDSITIINSGFIVGAGGNGGQGGSGGTGVAGAGGGPALIAQRPVSINNANTIAGGGGGGGGGAGSVYNYNAKEGGPGTAVWNGGGGGGGRSSAAVNSAAGPAGNGVGSFNTFNGTAGGIGTVSSQGGGGGGGSGTAGGGGTRTGGSGGSGGGWGAGGGTGGIGTNTGNAGGGGGGGGVAIAGNGNISWIATGTLLGGIT